MKTLFVCPKRGSFEFADYSTEDSNSSGCIVISNVEKEPKYDDDKKSGSKSEDTEDFEN
jgi:hypothetical protein